MSTLLTGTYTQVAAALQQINSNCNLPNYGTTSWSYFYTTVIPDFAFILSPPADGWNPVGSPGFTYDEMMKNVIDVTGSEFDPLWNPTSPSYSQG
jgi:hypothetical protein